MTESIRDAAVTAAVFGFFAAGWFGWAQEAPPQAWRPVLDAGSVLSILTALVGGLQAWRHRSGPSAVDEHSGPRFGLIVGIELAVAAIGAVVLTQIGRGEWVPVWIALVVGVHFFPLAPLLENPLLYVVAALVTVAAVAAIPVSNSLSLAPSALTGAAVGAILLGAGLLSLARPLIGLGRL